MILETPNYVIEALEIKLEILYCDGMVTRVAASSCVETFSIQALQWQIV